MGRNCAVASLIASTLLASTAGAATIVIDDFEVDEGHFNLAPSFSGTTQGETETSPGVGPSTADQEIGGAISGTGSQRIFMDDDSIDVANSNPLLAWRLRHLSGGGTPANNVSFTASGYVGYYLKTTTPDLVASIFIDDGAALERASYIPIIADGEWHLYQWDLDDETMWEGFAGADFNGVIDSEFVTIDGLFIGALQTFSGLDLDAVFNIDHVAVNADGMIELVPEPTSASLLLAAAGGLVGWRRRRC